MIVPGLESSAADFNFRIMSRSRCELSSWSLVFPAVLLITSCGLVKVPFRVAGVVAEGVYSTGKGAVDASSDAFEKRKAKKDLEKAAEEKKAAKEKAKEAPQEPSVLPPPDSVPLQQGPIIPIDNQPLPPIEPLPLPQ